MYEDSGISVLGPVQSGPVPRLEDFGTVEVPNERGWTVLLHAFKGRNSSAVLHALKKSGNNPVAVKDILGFTKNVFGGMNGASVHPGLPYRLELVHEGKSFQDNEVRFVRNDNLFAHGKGVLCF